MFTRQKLLIVFIILSFFVVETMAYEWNDFWSDVEDISGDVWDGVTDVGDWFQDLGDDAWDGAMNLISAGEQEDCGNLGDKLSESFATNVFIPDYFPPDEVAAQVLAPLVSKRIDWYLAPLCAFEDVAELYRGCREHDICMESRGWNGKSSEACDDAILDDWMRECKKYAEFSPCRLWCNDIVQFSWTIMTEYTSKFQAKTIAPTILFPLLLE